MGRGEFMIEPRFKTEGEYDVVKEEIEEAAREKHMQIE